MAPRNINSKVPPMLYDDDPAALFVGGGAVVTATRPRPHHTTTPHNAKPAKRSNKKKTAAVRIYQIPGIKPPPWEKREKNVTRYLVVFFSFLFQRLQAAQFVFSFFLVANSQTR